MAAVFLRPQYMTEQITWNPFRLVPNEKGIITK